jgi:shikimate kinase
MPFGIPPTPTHIEQRAAWSPSQSIFLLGPGGVGKSTLGRNLAPRLGLPLIDLDFAFCDAFAQIGQFIGEHGYVRYRAENLDLAVRLVQEAGGPVLLVTSSGFLAAAPGSDNHRRAHALVATGYGITLLPALDIDVATPIVVERQLQRGFGFERESEIRKFRERFAAYRHAGDMSIFSTAEPDEIAAVVERSLQP